ncbi:hypothetical protein [Streptococcus equi]|uniref:hypothetical protein n=1 Tax=Streptococcus equi TaxID=1336 RepID=UPI000DFA5782|nr:hypothetical protein [Streptococcus equi]HEL1015103.1 hypothetical protein [Streptococcus equi subsp. ruminatorum]MCD3383033.1 hypothetical protein [Streptococcus equi subsp. zooepidemicus]MCD3418963.1 hypothetical protein [Streptococcus equi subsp. zooepidemicus]MCD3424895.1 hypothetical protein [Streptococcus equi subsp. zooepidemicus]MDI6000334.1 hypothetical protein [Streptococcus equi subsp. zooepidemicus]
MEVLTINQECSFLINEREIKPEDLSKQDLLELFNTIYELDDINSLQIPDDVEINKIKNPVEKEIVNQIIQKIQEFKDNLEQIKQDIESSFPNLETE